jgi:hypothetical protein
MPQDKATIMRDFVEAMVTGEELDKFMTRFTDDAVFTHPLGTFKGKDDIKNHMAAMARNVEDLKIQESGNGIIVQGDKAFFEHSVSWTFGREKTEFLSMCAYEFSGDKIKSIREVYDRLLIAQQAAKGWLPKTLINMVVKHMEKAMQ